MNTNLNTFEIFPWNENLATGILTIDVQHKKLIQLLNQLTESLIKEDGFELSRVFDELTTYTAYHFETEEAIWSSYFGDDELLAKHEEAHGSFLPTVLELKAQHGEKPLREVTETIVKFLVGWLASHIVDNDKRMAMIVHNIDAGLPISEAKAKSAAQMKDASTILIDTVLSMYEGLSTRTFDLMRERVERQEAEQKLHAAYRELEKHAVTDKLTDLYNRRHFEQIFGQELRRAQREKRELAFIMFDIDHFKKLNDHYGHIEGDGALKKIGKALKELCRRPGDFVFRLGGEEFGVIIADNTADGVRVFAETIRQTMEDLKIPNINSNVSDHLTVSLGLVVKIPGDDDTMESFMSVADERLYKAKQQGRNNVVR